MIRWVELGRQLGNPVPALLPYKVIMNGQYVRMLPLEADNHYSSLFENISKTQGLFDFLLESRPISADEYRQRLKDYEQDQTRLHFVIELLNPPGDYVGLLCLAHADPKNKKIEMGRVTFSYKLQKTPASTESYRLLIGYAFEDLSYNKIQAKMSIYNKKAIANFKRFGLVHQGTLRDEIVVNGCAIDGQLFSLLETEWPAVKRSVQAWLDTSNFDSNGRQIKSLTEIRQMQ